MGRTKTQAEALDALFAVIGSPKENCEATVKSVLKEDGFACEYCNLKSSDWSAGSIEILSSLPPRLVDPSRLDVEVRCYCGTVSKVALRPNPLVIV